jgi:hypothetical protein
MVWQLRCLPLLLLALVLCSGCGGGEGAGALSTKAFPKGEPQPLTYENVSTLINDMDTFASAVKKLDQDMIKTVDQRYSDVQFEMEQPALFLNVYPDAPNGRVVFLLVPKDPETGANYLLAFEKKLPVIDAYSIEAHLRNANQENPITCAMTVADPVAYVQDHGSHTYRAHYLMSKRFFQSGTYDFDSLHFESYRSAGNVFVVFDPLKIELKDTTANLSCICK